MHQMTRNYPVPPAVTFDAVGSGGYLQLKQRTYLIWLKNNQIHETKKEKKENPFIPDSLSLPPMLPEDVPSAMPHSPDLSMAVLRSPFP